MSASSGTSAKLSPQWFGVFVDRRLLLYNGERILGSDRPLLSAADFAAGPLLATPERLARLPEETRRALTAGGILQEIGRTASCGSSPAAAHIDAFRAPRPAAIGFPLVITGSLHADVALALFERWGVSHKCVANAEVTAEVWKHPPQETIRAACATGAGCTYALRLSDSLWDSTHGRAAEWCAAAGIDFVPGLMETRRLVLGPYLRPNTLPTFDRFRRRRLSRVVGCEDTAALFGNLFSAAGRELLPLAAVHAGFGAALYRGLAALLEALNSKSMTDSTAPVVASQLDNDEARLSWLIAAPTAGTAEFRDSPAEATHEDAILQDGGFGLIRRFGDITPLELANEISIVSGLSTNLVPLHPQRQLVAAPAVVAGGGVARDARTAREKAVSEVLERSALSLAQIEAIGPVPFRELQQRAIPPDSLILYSREQYARPNFPFVPFTGDTPICWCRAYTLTDRSPCLIPATLVGGRRDLCDGEHVIGRYTTSGVAAHRTRRQALLAGLYELIERDAVMCTWLARLPGERLSLCHPDQPSSALVEEAQHYSNLLQRSGFRTEAYRLPTDLPVPVVVALGFRTDGRRPRYLFGAGARRTTEAAHCRALQEACQFLGWEESAIPDHFEPGNDFSNVRGFREHYLLFNNPQTWSEFDFLRAGPPAQPDVESSRPDDDELESLVAALRASRFEPLEVPLTTHDVRVTGRVATALVVPGLHPVNEAHDLACLDLRRVHSVAARLGRTVRRPNPHPHPLP